MQPVLVLAFIVAAVVAPCAIYFVWHLLSSYICGEWSFWTVGQRVASSCRVSSMVGYGVRIFRFLGLGLARFTGKLCFRTSDLQGGSDVESQSSTPDDRSIENSVEPRVVVRTTVSTAKHRSPAIHPISEFPLSPTASSISASGIRGTSSVYLPGSIIIVPPETSGSAVFAPGPRPLPVLIEV